MLRFVRALAYRDQVLRHLEALLLIYPRGRQFTEDYPGLRKAIGRHFDEGLSAGASAAQLSGAIIGDFAAQLDPAERAAACAALSSKELDGLREIAARRISRRPATPADSVAFVADLIGVAVLVARDMSGGGRLGRSEYFWFLAELDRAVCPEPGDAEHGSRPGLLARKFGLGESAREVAPE